MNPYYVESMHEKDRADVEKLLKRQDLELEQTVDYTAVLKHHGTLVGTCSYEKNVLKSFAVQACYQGSGGASQLLTHVLNKLFDAGHYTVMAYTLSYNRSIFEAMHFRCVHDTGQVVLLETGVHRLKKVVEAQAAVVGKSRGVRSAIVVNGNPFTKGHQSLIEKAAEETDEVLVFVVEEDRSVFSFEHRLALIRKGTEYLPNVTVLPGGPYMVSMATFPHYFTRDASDHARLGAELDAGIFGSKMVPVFQIDRRYVGTEPYCAMTAIYNRTLKRVLGQYGVELDIIERKEVAGNAISASEVRRLLVQKQWKAIANLVPESTLAFLKSDAAAESILALERKVTPH